MGIRAMQKIFVVASIQSTEMNLIMKEVQCLPIGDQTKDTGNDQIIALLNDDSIYVWRAMNGEPQADNDPDEKHTREYEIKKRIRPIELRDRYLQEGNATELGGSQRLRKSNGVSAVDKITKDYSKGLISFIQFTRDLVRMVVGTIDGYLMVFAVENWELISVCRASNVEFLRAELFDIVRGDGSTGGCVLSTVISGQRVAMCELGADNEVQVMGVLERNGIFKQNVSRNGNMLANVSSNGKVYIYNAMSVWSKFKRTVEDVAGADEQLKEELIAINGKVR